LASGGLILNFFLEGATWGAEISLAPCPPGTAPVFNAISLCSVARTLWRRYISARTAAALKPPVFYSITAAKSTPKPSYVYLFIYLFIYCLPEIINVTVTR